MMGTIVVVSGELGLRPGVVTAAAVTVGVGERGQRERRPTPATPPATGAESAR